MPKANVNDIVIEYEIFGESNLKPILLIAGLGSQLLAWPEIFCEILAENGFFIIRFDNRDVGLSTKFDDKGIPDMAEISAAYVRGERPKIPYTLEDMADDAIGLLDALHIKKAHICGASMGGMIAQIIAYRHPTRVLSLTVIMSTTGNPELPPSNPEIMMQFFAPVPSEREAYINEMIKRDSLINGAFSYDENQSREYRTKEYDRSYYPDGIARQLAAMAVPGNIKPYISSISVPTVVIHGSEDPFNLVEAGKEIASSISDAVLVIIEGMGHSFPREVIPRIISEIVKNSKKA